MHWEWTDHLGGWRLGNIARSAALALLAGTVLSGAVAVGSEQPLLKLRAVPFTDVKIQDGFWAPRRETNRLASIPFSLRQLEEAGNLENMRLAARGATSGFRGPVFMDSDLYKAIEAASYSLATHPDPALEKQLDDIIAILAAAQQPDGYLDSYFIVKEPGKRWTNLRDWHELYCAGHMFEAAVAHFQATGKKTFLNIATRYADYIDSVFGVPPKRLGYPGHPEIELALMKLWRATGNQRYFELARFFVENRGRKFFATEHGTPLDKYDGSYWQDDVPIYDHKNIKGHAVRAAYLMSGVTDVATQTGDARLLGMLSRVWRNTTERNEYITGGIGPSAHNEGFTVDYDLPNLTAYQETCATVALAQWADRLALLYGDAHYADVVERALYNGVLSGVSQDGTKFFYVNPLESAGTHHRSPWFGCACCPPNVTRTLAALGGYAYATSADSLYVNLYIQGSARAKVGDTAVTLNVKTEYPWEGKVTLQLTPAVRARLALRLRVPGWCENASVKVNRHAVKAPTIERGYLVLDREWKRGDRVELNLPMPVQRVAANPHVKADVGLLALQRGPIVYCLEQCDQAEPLAEFWLPAGAELKAAREPKLLGGVVTITGRGPGRVRAAVAPHALPAGGSGPACRAEGDSLLRLGQPPAGADEGLAAGRAAIGAGARARGKSHGQRQLRQRQLPAARHQRRPGAEEQRRATRSLVSLVAAQGHHGMGSIHLEGTRPGEPRQGVLVRRHRSRRVPAARLVADRIPGRQRLEAGCRQ